jgi:hypothetical protein
MDCCAKHCFTEKPTIIIPEYDVNAKDGRGYKQLVVLTNQDQIYLNIWREKARKLYKKYNGIFTEEDEKYLVDPDPFESKWYVFRIKSKSRKPTPTPSPIIYPEPIKNNQGLLSKFAL